MDTLKIPVKILEINSGVYENQPYTSLTARVNVDEKDKLVKFKADVKKGVDYSGVIDKEVVLELAFVVAFGGNAGLKVVGFTE